MFYFSDTTAVNPPNSYDAGSPIPPRRSMIISCWTSMTFLPRPYNASIGLSSARASLRYADSGPLHGGPGISAATVCGCCHLRIYVFLRIFLPSAFASNFVFLIRRTTAVYRELLRFPKINSKDPYLALRCHHSSLNNSHNSH